MNTTGPGTLRRKPGRRAGRLAVVGPVLAAAVLLTAAGLRGHDGVIPRFAAEVDAGGVAVKEPGFGDGQRYGAGVFFKTGHRTGLEVLLETYDVAVAAGAAGLKTGGRMAMTSLLINQELFLLTHGRVLPYGLVGIGFTFIGYAPDEPVDPELDFVDRLSLQLGGGIDVRISRAVALSGKFRYNMVKTWVETLPRTAPIRDTDPLAQDMLQLYGLGLSLGLKISF
jgi:opacity protein-like surface antigen